MTKNTNPTPNSIVLVEGEKMRHEGLTPGLRRIDKARLARERRDAFARERYRLLHNPELCPTCTKRPAEYGHSLSPLCADCASEMTGLHRIGKK